MLCRACYHEYISTIIQVMTLLRGGGSGIVLTCNAVRLIRKRIEKEKRTFTQMLLCQPFFFSFAAPRERIEVGSCYPSRLLLFTGCRSDPWVEVQVLSPPVLQIYGDRSTIFH